MDVFDKIMAVNPNCDAPVLIFLRVKGIVNILNISATLPKYIFFAYCISK